MENLLIVDKLEQLFYKTENGFELLIQIQALFMLKV
jgi:hypothetical protein